MHLKNTKSNNKKIKSLAGFTLVELIVVITILVILGTIAFTSLGGYSGSARDSSRVSDLANISKGLDIAYIKTNSYPSPDNAFTITYSGGALWYQGTIGSSVMNILSSVGAKISKKPTDPLNTTQEYTYSKLAYGNEYQLKTDWEGDSVTHNMNPSLITKTYADSGNPTLAYIKGTYNGMVAKTQTGNIVYLLAVPSIVTSQTGTTGQSIDSTSVLSYKFLIHGQTNSWGVAYVTNTPKFLVYYAGTLPTSYSERIILATNIATAYSGTILTSNTQIQSLITAVQNNDTGSLASLWGNMINAGTTSVSSWTIANGGGCTDVDNILGSNGDTSSCIDNRTYVHTGSGVTHSKIYNLLKIEWRWWFNQNLAYPLTTGYQWDDVWPSTDIGYYSCPGNDNTTTVDCGAVSTFGYLYQWSAAMNGAISNSGTIARTQGICPSGWGIPTKTDFTSIGNSYWPTSDAAWGGNTVGWSQTHAGYRDFSDMTFYNRSTGFLQEWIWSSFESSTATSRAWFTVFSSIVPWQPSRNSAKKANGYSVRCIKN